MIDPVFCLEGFSRKDTEMWWCLSREEEPH